MKRCSGSHTTREASTASTVVSFWYMASGLATPWRRFFTTTRARWSLVTPEVEAEALRPQPEEGRRGGQARLLLPGLEEGGPDDPLGHLLGAEHEDGVVLPGPDGRRRQHRARRSRWRSRPPRRRSASPSCRGGSAPCAPSPPRRRPSRRRRPGSRPCRRPPRAMRHARPPRPCPSWTRRRSGRRGAGRRRPRRRPSCRCEGVGDHVVAVVVAVQRHDAQLHRLAQRPVRRGRSRSGG